GVQPQDWPDFTAYLQDYYRQEDAQPPGGWAILAGDGPGRRRPGAFRQAPAAEPEGGSAGAVARDRPGPPGAGASGPPDPACD
ncbi:MAG: hypothetical protein D6809_05300, partial [Gammaproteobacteria bacterium]